MKRLADFEAERTRLLGEQGIRSVVGNFAAGHPPWNCGPISNRRWRRFASITAI